MVRWNWVLPVVVLALLVFGFFFVRPLDPLPPDPDAEATARAWNDAVGRLGIQPVFPPEEDFHVGDVWAVIADTEDRPLLGRAIRIGHLDLRQVLLESQAGRPVFADTAMDTNGVKLKQAPAEVEPPPKNDRITLSLAAFPGVTIRHAVRADADLRACLSGLNLRRLGLAWG